MGDWRVCTFELLWLFFGKKVVFSKTYPSFLTLKEGSTFLTKPLFPQGRENVTALRCSEPLRSKVGGPSKVSPGCAGWDRLGIKALYKHVVGDEEILLIAGRIKTVKNTMSMFYYIEY